MNSSHEYLGGSNWAASLEFVNAASADTLLKTAKASSGLAVQGGGAMTNRLVILGWHIQGHNTNAAATIIKIRGVTGNLPVFIGGSMGPTTGSISSDNTDAWICCEEDDSLEVSITGVHTGNLSITVWGKLFPASTPLADKYDMTA